jgi:hypothetical protein
VKSRPNIPNRMGPGPLRMPIAPKLYAIHASIEIAKQVEHNLVAAEA